MASLYFRQTKTKTGVLAASLHVYRSFRDPASKSFLKVHLGKVPKSTREVPAELAAKLSADELLHVVAKIKEVSDQFASQLHAATEQLKAGSHCASLMSLIRAAGIS
jgi:hypothetical protein